MRIEIPVTESSFRYKLQNRFTSQRNAYSHANGIPIPIRPESLFRSNGMSILIDRNTHLSFLRVNIDMKYAPLTSQRGEDTIRNLKHAKRLNPGGSSRRAVCPC